MKACDLLNALINVAEKGANIARIIRSEKSLLELLVQEKKGDQKNERFVQDFKTLADVLVQEVVRYDLKIKFPGFGSSIYGEESNTFTNTLGDSVTVAIQDNPEKTGTLLKQVLDDNNTAAKILSDVIHQEVVSMEMVAKEELNLDLPGDNLGVWIDPIDSTAQYIQGAVGKLEAGLVTEGLQCVCVLVGVYDKTTGMPVMGVINQPFSSMDESGSWVGKTAWGVCIDTGKGEHITCNNISITPSTSSANKPTTLISSSESQAVQETLSSIYALRHIAGAGYKLLGTCEGRAEAYVLTRASNYRWDCCGPHAILLSLGGGIVKYDDLYNYAQSGQTDYATISQIKYHEPDQPGSTGAMQWCNMGGIVAYKSIDTLEKLANVIKGKKR